MDATFILRAIIIIYALVFLAYMLKDCYDHKEELTTEKFLPLAIIGFITDFLDTLGIGSFATTQAGFKFTKSCEDELMPGTLNIGHGIPVITEFVLFLGLIEVETLTLVLMVAASAIGAVIGASIVSRWNVKIVRIALGVALVAMVIVMSCRQLAIGPFGVAGTALGLSGIKLVIGVVINFFLGAFMTIGVGLYAPCMALVGALGMNVSAAFPIMFGSCAFLMPSAGITFVREGKYDRKASLIMTVFGVIGVFCAYLFVSSLDITILTWIVIVVMCYTSVTFFRDAAKTQV